MSANKPVITEYIDRLPHTGPLGHAYTVTRGQRHALAIDGSPTLVHWASIEREDGVELDYLVRSTEEDLHAAVREVIADEEVTR